MPRRLCDFERGEGAEWTPRDLIDGGLGNVGEFSYGLRTGNEERIREGHPDTRWTAYVLADAYQIDLTALAIRYAEAQRELRDGAVHRNLTEIRANMLEAANGLPRFGAVLDGRRTLPAARERFQSALGEVVYYSTLAVPVANRAHGLQIDPEKNFEEQMDALSVRIALQTLYGQLREGLLDKSEARDLSDRLALYGLQRGISLKTLATIWRKAPTRVRGMESSGLPLPSLP